MLMNKDSSTTLNCPIVVGHRKSLEPTLMFNCHQISSIKSVLIFEEFDVGDYFIYAIFVLGSIEKVFKFVGCLHEEFIGTSMIQGLRPHYFHPD